MAAELPGKKASGDQRPSTVVLSFLRSVHVREKTGSQESPKEPVGSSGRKIIISPSRMNLRCEKRGGTRENSEWSRLTSNNLALGLEGLGQRESWRIGESRKLRRGNDETKWKNLTGGSPLSGVKL